MAAPFLSSCGTSLPSAPTVLVKTEYVRQEVPAVLVEVVPEPAKPGEPLSDEAVAGYIVDIREWGRTGWGQVEAIGRITAPAPQ